MEQPVNEDIPSEQTDELLKNQNPKLILNLNKRRKQVINAFAQDNFSNEVQHDKITPIKKVVKATSSNAAITPLDFLQLDKRQLLEMFLSDNYAKYYFYTKIFSKFVDNG